MERVAFERGLDSLLRSQVAVKELVTDGHLEISALMSEWLKRILCIFSFLLLFYFILVALPQGLGHQNRVSQLLWACIT